MAQSKIAIQQDQIPLYHQYISSDHQQTRFRQGGSQQQGFWYTSPTEDERKIFNAQALRIASFNTDLGSFADFSVLQLALEGFFNTQRGREIKCFSCGLVIKLDIAPVDPFQIHRNGNRCPYLRGQDETNVKFGTVSVRENRQTNRPLAEQSDSVSDDVLELGQSVRNVSIENTNQGPQNSTGPVWSSLNQPQDIVVEETAPARTTRNLNRQVAVKDYRLELCRLQSYQNWPSNAAVKPEDLANAGFYYMGTDDRVQCIFCRGILRSWEPEDRALAEHLRHFPQCPFLTDPQAAGNVPLGQEDESVFSSIQMRGESEQGHDFVTNPIPGVHLERPAHPEYAQVPQRLSTFKDYPSNAFHTPENLVRAGFYYTNEVDAVRCFFCNVYLKNWRPEHDPWVQHVRASQRCGYLRMTKGDIFIEEVLKTSRNPEKKTKKPKSSLRKKALKGTKHKVKAEEVDRVMRSSLVRSVIDMKIAEEPQIRKVVNTRLQQLGNEFPNAESLIEAITDYQDNPEPSSESSDSEDQSSEDVSPAPQFPARRTVEPELPEDEESLRSLNERLREERLCKVCLDEPATIVFLRCGHLVCCGDCAPAMTKCPVCRQHIMGTIRADI